MVNPLLSPVNSTSLLIGYLRDPTRIHRIKPEQVKKYQNKVFRKTVKYAYKTPVYHDKYKKAGVHPDDIKTIDDIKKLPFITKDDLRKNYPDGLIPHGSSWKKYHSISTGGTTGKSVSIFTDFYVIGKASFLQIRELKNYGLKWNKVKYAHVGNFSEGRIDLVAKKNFQKHIKIFFPSEKRLDVDVNIPGEKLIEKLDSFEPDVILSYPAVFQNLASLKRKGFGEKIRPKILFCGGSVLDTYTRRYVENTFNCPLRNTYQSVEAQGVIATECLHKTWHVNDDFFYLEVIDENNDVVNNGERGHIVITRLFTGGTPIIRYTGMDDWVKIKNENEKCECGLRTSILEDGVEGRPKADIILPDGKVFPAGAFCFIEPVLAKHKTFIVKQYQIIQKKIDQIDILLVIEEEFRDKKNLVEQIKKEIKEIYTKKTSSQVAINVKEVKKVKHPFQGDKPAPIVISEVEKNLV